MVLGLLVGMEVDAVISRCWAGPAPEVTESDHSCATSVGEAGVDGQIRGHICVQEPSSLALKWEKVLKGHHVSTL